MFTILAHENVSEVLKLKAPLCKNNFTHVFRTSHLHKGEIGHSDQLIWKYPCSFCDFEYYHIVDFKDNDNTNKES